MRSTGSGTYNRAREAFDQYIMNVFDLILSSSCVYLNILICLKSI